jgi:hypothetical protein
MDLELDEAPASDFDDDTIDLGLSDEYFEKLARGEIAVDDPVIVAATEGVATQLDMKLEIPIKAADPTVDFITPENVDELDSDNFGWEIKRTSEYRLWLARQYIINEAQRRMYLDSQKRRAEKKK